MAAAEQYKDRIADNSQNVATNMAEEDGLHRLGYDPVTDELYFEVDNPDGNGSRKFYVGDNEMGGENGTKITGEEFDQGMADLAEIYAEQYSDQEAGVDLGEIEIEDAADALEPDDVMKN